MSNVARYGLWIAIISLSIGYALLAHYTNAVPGHETLGPCVAITPIILAALTMAWHSRYRSILLVTFGVIGVTTFIRWDTLERHFYWIYWIEHAGTQLILCLVFARTLSAGREPMCSYVARLVHGSLEPALARYTRQITIAWAVFFGLMSVT